MSFKKSDKNSAINTRLENLKDLFLKKNEDLTLSQINDIIRGNHNALNQQADILSTVFTNPPQGLARLDKQGAEAKIARSKKLFSRGKRDTTIPYSLYNSKLVSTRINKDYVPSYNQSTVPNDNRFKDLTNDLEKNKDNLYDGIYDEDSDTLRNKYNRELGEIQNDVQEMINKINGQGDSVLGKKPAITYNTVYDYYLDNKTINPSLQNKNPFVRDLQNNLSSNKLGDKDGKFSNKLSDKFGNIFLTNDKSVRQEHETLEELLRYMRTLEDSINDTNTRVNSKDDKINRNINNNAADNIYLREILNERDEIAKNEIMRRDASLLQLESKINSLASDKKDLIKIINELEEKIRNNEDNSLDNQNYLKDLNEQLSKTQNELKSAYEDLESMNSRVRSYDIKLNERDQLIENNLNELNDRIAFLTETNNKLKEKLNEGDESLNEEIERNALLLDNLNRNKKQFDEFKKDTESGISTLNDELENRLKETEKLKNRLQESELEKEELDRKIINLKSDFVELSQTNFQSETANNLQKEIDKLKEDLKEKTDEINVLSNSIVKLEDENKTLRYEQNANNLETNNKLDELFRNNINIKSELNKNEQLKSQLETFIENRDLNTNSQIEDIIDEFTKSNNELKEEIKTLSEDKESNDSRIDSLIEELNKREDTITNLLTKHKAVAVNVNHDNDDDKMEITENNNNNGDDPPPPPSGSSAIATLDNAEDVLKTLSDITDNAEKNIMKNNLEYNQNIADINDEIVNNTNTVDTVIPVSTFNQELREVSSRIQDDDWREFFDICLTNSVFINILDSNGIQITTSDFKIIFNEKLIDSMTLLEFISRMSNTRYKLIRTVYRISSKFDVFLRTYGNTGIDQDLSFGIQFKYIVALYNQAFNRNLQFRHHSEINESESINVLFNGKDLTTVLLSLLQNLDCNESQCSSFGKLMKLILDNLRRHGTYYNDNFQRTLNNILLLLKNNLSDNVTIDHYIRTFKRYSKTWNKYYYNSGIGNELLAFKDPKLTVELFKTMMMECIENGISVPSRGRYNIQFNTRVDIFKLYRRTRSMRNVIARNIGEICMWVYVYIGVTVNSSSNSNVQVINHFMTEFETVFSQSGLLLPEETNNTISYPAQDALLQNLTNAYQRFIDEDSNSTKELALRQNKNTLKAVKDKKIKNNRPTLKKTVKKESKKQELNNNNRVKNEVDELLGQVGLKNNDDNNDDNDNDNDNLNIFDIDMENEVIEDDRFKLENEKILVQTNNNKTIKKETSPNDLSITPTSSRILQLYNEKNMFNDNDDDNDNNTVIINTEDDSEELKWDNIIDNLVDETITTEAKVKDAIELQSLADEIEQAVKSGNDIRDYRFDNADKNRSFIPHGINLPYLPTNGFTNNDMMRSFDGGTREFLNNNQDPVPPNSTRKRIITTLPENNILLKKEKKLNEFKKTPIEQLKYEQKIINEASNLDKVKDEKMIKELNKLEIKDEFKKIEMSNNDILEIQDSILKDLENDDEKKDINKISKFNSSYYQITDNDNINDFVNDITYVRTVDNISSPTTSIPMINSVEEGRSTVNDILKLTEESDIKNSIGVNILHMINKILNDRNSHINLNDISFTGSNIEDTRNWLQSIKNEQVQPFYGRFFIEMLHYINSILESNYSDITINYNSILEYIRNKTILTYQNLTTEDTIVASIFYRAIIDFIQNEIIFKEEKKNTLYKKLAKLILYYLIIYLTNN